MKKTFIYMLVAIILGGISGKILYQKYDETELVFNESNRAYFLQEGVYETKDSLERNTKDIDPKLVINKNNKYYVYVGISKSLDGINKIKKTYKKKGYSTTKKEIEVADDSFLTNLEQYDILLDSAISADDILTIEEVVLSNYEEISKN